DRDVAARGRDGRRPGDLGGQGVADEVERDRPAQGEIARPRAADRRGLDDCGVGGVYVDVATGRRDIRRIDVRLHVVGVRRIRVVRVAADVVVGDRGADADTPRPGDRAGNGVDRRAVAGCDGDAGPRDGRAARDMGVDRVDDPVEG